MNTNYFKYVVYAILGLFVYAIIDWILSGSGWAESTQNGYVIQATGWQVLFSVWPVLISGIILGVFLGIPLGELTHKKQMTEKLKELDTREEITQLRKDRLKKEMEFLEEQKADIKHQQALLDDEKMRLSERLEKNKGVLEEERQDKEKVLNEPSEQPESVKPKTDTKDCFSGL